MPLLQLLAIFFAGAAFALASSSSHLTLASAADVTQLVPRAVTSDEPLLLQAPSCPRPLFHTARNATAAVVAQQHQQPVVLAHNVQPDPTPFSSIPQKAPPSMSADHSRTAPPNPATHKQEPLSLMAMLPARSRIRAVVLGGWAPAGGKPLFQALVPAWWRVEAGGGDGAEHARRRDLSAVAASALRMGSPSLHVAAAVSGLLLLGTIMCTL